MRVKLYRHKYSIVINLTTLFFTISHINIYEMISSIGVNEKYAKGPA